MKALILAAGFGTRLIRSAEGTKFESLIKEVPKPLLPIEGKPVISYIVEKLESSKLVSEALIITNNKFLNQFEDWLSSFKTTLPVKIINNQVNSLQEMKGAIRDLNFAIKEGNVDDDLLMIAGDNLFYFQIKNFIDFFNLNNKDSIVIKKLKNKDEAKLKYGVVSLDGNKIISFEEKPEFPKTDLATCCIYLLKKETLPLLDLYLKEDDKHDSPGNFISWLTKKKEVLAWITDVSSTIDIGSLNQIEKILY